MGEIATWSAVKTKTGFGKEGNDCPTKAELLALPSTGSGEDYAWLEIGNASSYGANECVKLEDVHKATYRYSFSQGASSLSFSALGGLATSTAKDFGISSYRQKYWDGTATGSSESVSYSQTSVSWASEGSRGWGS